MEDFEKNIQKHFQQRSIQPSENTWNRLEELLDKEEQKQKKRTMLNWWNSKYTIAAVLVIGLGLLGTIYQWENKENTVFDSNKMNTSPSHQVVVENIEEKTTEPTIVKSTSEKNSTLKSASKRENSSIASTISSKDKVVEEKSEAEENFIFKEAPLKINSEVIVHNKTIEEPALLPQEKIYVNPQKLLIKAEMDKNIDNSLTDKQYVIKKLKEINTVVTK